MNSTVMIIIVENNITVVVDASIFTIVVGVMIYVVVYIIINVAVIVIVAVNNVGASAFIVLTIVAVAIVFCV